MPEGRRCQWCGRGLPDAAGRGRPRQFCKDGCRQMAYSARRRAAELGLGESELIVARQDLDELRDALYVVEAAVEDVDRDVGAADGNPEEVRRALDWLLEAVRPLLS